MKGALAMGFPTIYPTGATVYDPKKSANGYTAFATENKTILIDMNGHQFNLLQKNGFATQRSGNKLQNILNQDVFQNKKEHHNNQLNVVYETVTNSQLTDQPLLDSGIYEIDSQKNVIWQWHSSDHFNEFGFDEIAKNAIYREIQQNHQTPWLTIENARKVGENKWFDAGDERFNPENIIFGAPNANIIAILNKETARIVWQLGPRFDKNETVSHLEWLINPGDAHFIAKGFPGAGHLLVFDHGGSAGYGLPNGTSKDGIANEHREYSRVLEIDPTTFEIKWQYTPDEAGHVQPLDSYKFYSANLGSAQRLVNGNTLITEGNDGRIFEVTVKHEIVWEFINPFFEVDENGLKNNWISEVRRISYSSINQLKTPKEVAIEPVNVTNFRVTGSPNGANAGKVTIVDGVDPNRLRAVYDPHSPVGQRKSVEHDFCVVTFTPHAKQGR